MKRSLLFLLAALVISGAASAQIFTFDWSSVPNGTNLGPGWTEHLGDWNTVNNAAESAQGSGWQYATQQARTHVDCATECVVIYNTASPSRLQFGGTTIRANDPGNGSLGRDLIMAKIQDNNSSGDFDRFFLYEISATGASRIVKFADFTFANSTRATVRLLAIDQRVVAQVDGDNDGLWDIVIDEPVTLAAKTGPVGLNGFRGNQCDDFKLWDMVLLGDPGSAPPNPGNRVDMVMRGPANRQFIAATSLGNGSLPVGSITVPLTPDSIFFTSVANVLPAVFQNFRGSFDGNGDTKIAVALPLVPALVGITFYTAAVDSTLTFVSNDHQVTIT